MSLSSWFADSSILMHSLFSMAKGIYCNEFYKLLMFLSQILNHTEALSIVYMSMYIKILNMNIYEIFSELRVITNKILNQCLQ